MKIGSKAIGVVALIMATMVVLQLMVAPTAMARFPRLSNETIIMVTKEGGKVQRVPCGQGCGNWIQCMNPDCTCIEGICYRGW